jgi:hypothetical protein
MPQPDHQDIGPVHGDLQQAKHTDSKVPHADVAGAHTDKPTTHADTTIHIDHTVKPL